MGTSIISSFETGAQGWTVIGDPSEFGQQPSGGNPNGFLHWTDAAAGADCYYQAGAQFLGNKSGFFGGSLSFDVYDSVINYDGVPDVVLTGGGLTLVCDLPQPGTTWTHLTVALDASAGWKVDSLSGATATAAQIQKVLGSLSQLQIRAEYAAGSEDGGLDNVSLTSPYNVSSGSGSADSFTGTKFADYYQALGGNDSIQGGSGDDLLYGGAGDDVIVGQSGNDTLYGGAGNDRIFGGAGDDRLYGQAGDDRITPGLGADIAWGGLQDADRFIFNSPQEVGGEAGTFQLRDRIVDFEEHAAGGGDRIDFSHMNPVDIGAEHFVFVGSAPFTAPGQIAISVGNNATAIILNTDTDTQGDFAMVLTGAHNLSSIDFIL